MSGPELPEGLDLIGVLEASRAREKAQTLFYRALAAEASAAADQAAVDRLNDLHADEQHHLSRLTVRLLELGHAPLDLSSVPAPVARLATWEPEARAREVEEVRWYEAAVALDLDAATRGVLSAILDSERHHERELAGKWMSA